MSGYKDWRRHKEIAKKTNTNRRFEYIKGLFADQSFEGGRPISPRIGSVLLDNFGIGGNFTGGLIRNVGNSIAIGVRGDEGGIAIGVFKGGIRIKKDQGEYVDLPTTTPKGRADRTTIMRALVLLAKDLKNEKKPRFKVLVLSAADFKESAEERRKLLMERIEVEEARQGLSKYTTLVGSKSVREAILSGFFGENLQARGEYEVDARNTLLAFASEQRKSFSSLITEAVAILKIDQSFQLEDLPLPLLEHTVLTAVIAKNASLENFDRVETEKIYGILAITAAGVAAHHNLFGNGCFDTTEHSIRSYHWENHSYAQASMAPFLLLERMKNLVVSFPDKAKGTIEMVRMIMNKPKNYFLTDGVGEWQDIVITEKAGDKSVDVNWGQEPLDVENLFL